MVLDHGGISDFHHTSLDDGSIEKWFYRNPLFVEWLKSYRISYNTMIQHLMKEWYAIPEILIQCTESYVLV